MTEFISEHPLPDSKLLLSSFKLCKTLSGQAARTLLPWNLPLASPVGFYGGFSSHYAADLSLVDILTPANLVPLFQNHPELVPTLFPYLPPDLPVEPSADVLQSIIQYVITPLARYSALNNVTSSPQFRSAVASFDQALRTGLLGDFVRQLGLPAEAGIGIVPFLRAIQAKADRENRESGRMDTD